MANNKETITFEMELNTKDFDNSLKESEKKVNDLNKKNSKVELKADNSEVDKKIKETETSVKRIDNMKASAELDANDTNIKKSITDAKKDLDKIDNEKATAELKVSESGFKSVVASAKGKLNEFNNAYATAKLKIDDSEVGRKLESARGKLDSFAESATNAGTSLAPLSAGAGLVVGASAKAFLESESSLNRYKTVFGSATKEMDNFWKNNRENIMLTNGEWKAQTAGIGDLLKPLGFTEEQTAKTTQEIVTLAEAQSRWADIPLAETIERINAGILGETEGLKALGVKIDAEMIKERQGVIMAEKRKGVTEEMAKALATQELITEKSADAIKAYNQELKDGNEITTDFQNAQREMRQAFEDLGYSLAPVITGAIKAFNGLMKAFNALPQPVKNVIAGVLVFVAVLSPLLLFFGALAASISALIPVVTAMGAGISALGVVFAGLSAPIGLIVGAIGLLIFGLWTFRDEIGKFVTDTLAFWDTWWTGLVNGSKTNGELINQIFANIGEFLLNIFNVIFGSGTSDVIKAWFESVIVYFSDFGTNFMESWNIFTTTISEGLATFGETMSLGFQAIWTWISESWNIFKTSFIESWNNLGTNISEIVTLMMSGVSTAFEVGFSWVSEKVQVFKDFFIGVFNSVPSEIQSSLSQIFSGFQSVFSGIGSLVSSIMSGIVSSVQNAINGILSAINSMKSAVKNVDLNPLNNKGKSMNGINENSVNTSVNNNQRTTNIFNVTANSQSALQSWGNAKGITL